LPSSSGNFFRGSRGKATGLRALIISCIDPREGQQKSRHQEEKKERTVRKTVIHESILLACSCISLVGHASVSHCSAIKAFLQNYEMPQVRIASRPVLANHSGGGFVIRRVAFPGIVVAKCTIKPLARRARTPLSNKENVPPAGAVKAAPKRSPLHDWYPRTPLRDITSIVKVQTSFLGLFM